VSRAYDNREAILRTVDGCCADGGRPRGARPALTQDYPARPITLIVPFPARWCRCHGADHRPTADERAWQQVVIDNRGGVAGVLGMRAAAKAVADGYTLVFTTTGTTSINPSLYTQSRL